MKPAAPEIPSSRAKDGALYLDNAATSWPKPPGVAQAMMRYLDDIGANPGRSGHRMSIEAARIVYAAREVIANLFHAEDPLRVTFGLNITDGINQALHGLLKPGDHVITSSMEHNSVMRPLGDLSQRGVEFTQVACRADGSLNPASVESAIKPNTRMIVFNHASNVCGTILPINEIGRMARRRNLLFLVDTAQSAGAISIDMQQACIDLLAFTGHKSLYGPMGTGGLIFGDRVQAEDLHPLRQGGTGSRSEHEVQPNFFPDRCESGTPNAVGIAGLLAAVEWLQKEGIDQIHAHKESLCALLLEGLGNIPGVTLYGPHDATLQTSTVGFNIQGLEPSTVGLRLDEEFAILSRVGLHCAPSAHRTMGTFPIGCIRFSIGYFNTREDIDQAIRAVSTLASEVR